jgi:hypothetical protein
MQYLLDLLVLLLLGIGLVTIVDVIGSIVSRLLRFQYGYFAILSLVAYTTVAYLVVEKTNRLLPATLVVMAMGFYDAIVGWEIARKLKANHGYSKEMLEKLTIAHRVFVVNLYAIVSVFLGYYLAS